MTIFTDHQTNGRKKRTLNILRLYRQGKTKNEIAQMLNITVYNVAVFIARAGIRKQETKR